MQGWIEVVRSWPPEHKRIMLPLFHVLFFCFSRPKKTLLNVEVFGVCSNTGITFAVCLRARLLDICIGVYFGIVSFVIGVHMEYFLFVFDDHVVAFGRYGTFFLLYVEVVAFGRYDYPSRFLFAFSKKWCPCLHSKDVTECETHVSASMALLRLCRRNELYMKVTAGKSKRWQNGKKYRIHLRIRGLKTSRLMRWKLFFGETKNSKAIG